MAVTTLQEVIIPEIFTSYTVANSLDKTNLVESGVMVKNNVIQQQLAAGAYSFTTPFFNDLEGDPNLSNDDPSQHSVPNKITSGKQVVRKSFLNVSFSNMQLASELAGADVEAHIKNRIVSYWNRALQKRLLATLEGVKLQNIADDDGDMVHDISDLEDDAALFSAAAVIDACGTLGDRANEITALCVNSAVMREIMKQDLIETHLDSSGTMKYQTFRGLLLIQDDSLTVQDGKYTSILFGTGAIGYGLSAPTHAAGTAVEQIESAGLGGGQTVLHSRINSAIHPSGFSFTDVSVDSESPSLLELKDPLNWKRELPRRAIKLVFLVTKL